jgi:hypothetical protein
MEPKDTSLKASLADVELDRLSFLVYKKAMSLIGDTAKVLGLGLVLFSFFGFIKWKDISATLEDLETRAAQADSRAVGAERHLADLLREFETNDRHLKQTAEDVRTETGNLMLQVGTDAAGLKARFQQNEEAALREMADSQESNKNDLDTGLKNLRKEMADSTESRAKVERQSTDLQSSFDRDSTALNAQLRRVFDTGNMVLVLQDKHSTAISANKKDLKITLGDASKDQVGSVEIEYGGGSAMKVGKLKPDTPVDFTRRDPDGKTREYTFKIRQINMLAFRDLVTCDLSWEEEKHPVADQVARAGS